MKHLLLTTIAAVLVVGCATTQQSAPPAEAKPVVEAAKPEPPTVKAPDISIHDAARKGNIEAVKQHLDAGGDVDAKDKSGQTPLHRAAAWDRKEVAELLIAKGADLNAKIEAGQYTGTPLDWAEGVSRRDSPEVKASKKETADLLRKHGGKTGDELKAKGK